jgi:hypothetical protein
MLLLIFCFVPPPHSQLVMSSTLEAMAAEQNLCLETEHLLLSSSLTIAFHISTGVFQPVVLEKLQKDIFFHLPNISHHFPPW